MESLLSWIWKIIQGLVEAGIKLFGNVLMGFCSIALKLVNATSSGKVTVDGKQENIYTYICHAFNPVFWFSKNVLIPFGLAILSVVLVWNLSKIIMSGQKGTKDDPISLVRRTIIAGIVIYLTPYLILFGVGTDINTAGKYTDYNYRKVVSTNVSGMQVMPTLLDGLSSFDGDGTEKLKLSNNNIDALKNSSNKNDSGFEATNVNILIKGVTELGIDNVTKDDIGLGANDSTTEINNGDDGDPVRNAYSTLSGEKLRATAKNKGIPLTKKVEGKNGKKKKVKKTDKELLNDLVSNEYTMTDGDNSVLGTLSQSMYSEYGNSGWAKGIVWKIIYVIVFLIQPALIIWNLVQMLWVFVKRAVSLILSACLAPVAMAFYPSQSTSEVTSKWIKMVLGYGMTTALTFAFVKLGAFVYASIIQVQYREESLILTIILNFACLAILGFIKEMESYANNLGGNLVTFKNGISGQIGKMAAKWGEKGLFLPLGLGTKAIKTVPRAVGFATGRQGFFKNIGSRNLNKTKDKIDSNAYTKRANKADKQASKLLKKNPGISIEATKSAENSLNNFNAHKTTNGSLLTGAEVASATEKIPVSPVNGNTESLAKASGGTNYLTTENGFGVPKEVFKRGESTGTHNGTELFKPAQEDKHLFNGNTFDENGFISLSSSKEAPIHKIDSSGGFTSLRTQDGNMHIIDNKTTFDEMKNKVPSGTTLNRSSVVENVNGTPIISDGKNAIMASDLKTESEFNAMPSSARKDYEAFGLGGTEGDVVFAKRGSALENSKLSNK